MKLNGLGALLTAFLLASGGQAQPGTQTSSKPELERDEGPAEGIRVVPRPRPPRAGTFTVDVSTDRQNYGIGDSVRITFRANRDAYVYVYSTDPAGRTRQIFPNFYDRDNYVNAGVTYAIPDSSYDLVVEPPAGRETISIVAVRGQYATLDKYRRFSRSDPFPSGSGAKAEIQAVVPRDRREELVAEDSTTIYVTDHRRRPRPPVRPLPDDKPGFDDGRRYLW